MRENVLALARKTIAFLCLGILALSALAPRALAENFNLTETDCDHFALPPLAMDKLGLVGLTYVTAIHPEFHIGNVKIPGVAYDPTPGDAPKMPVLITVPPKTGEHGSAPEIKVISIGHKSPPKEQPDAATPTAPQFESSPVYVVEIGKASDPIGKSSVMATGQKNGDSANGSLMVKDVAEIRADFEVGGNFFKSNLAGGVQIVRVPIGSSVSLVASQHTTFRVFASDFDSKGSIAPGAEVKIEVPTSSGQALRFGLRGGPDVVMAPKGAPHLSGTVHAGVELVFF